MILEIELFIERVLLAVVFCLISILQCSAQSANLFIRNFPPGDYQSELYTSGPQNFDIIADQRGVMYLCNANALLEFDGVSWRTVNNIPDGSNFRSLAINEQGRIFTGGKNNIGYLTADSSGRIVFESLNKLFNISDYEVSKTYCIDQTVYFVADSAVFIYRNGTFKTIPSNGAILNSYRVNNRLFVLVEGQGLFEMYDSMLVFIKGTAVFLSLQPVSILSAIGNSDSYAWMLITREKIFSWRNESLTPFGKPGVLRRIHAALLLNGNTIALGTELDGLVLLDSVGQYVMSLNKSNGLNDNYITNIYADGRNGLWLSLQVGISRIDFPAPLQFYDERSGVDGVTICLQKYNGELYAGTNSGLYRKQFSNNTHRFRLDSALEFVWGFTSFDNLLGIAAEEGAFVQEGSKRTRLADKRAYAICYLSRFPDLLFTGTDNGINVFKRNENNWSNQGVIMPGNEITALLETKEGYLIAASLSEIYRIDLVSALTLSAVIDTYQVERPHNPDNLYYPFAFNNSLYAGSSYDGFFRYDASRRFFTRDSVLNKVLGSYQEAATPYVDFESNLWFVSDSRIGRIYNENGNYVWDTIPFKIIPKTTVHSFLRDGNTIWIGTSDGLYSFDMAVKKKYQTPYFTLLRQVKLNNNIIFEGSFFTKEGMISTTQHESFKRKIPYQSNSISFEFAAATYDSKDKTSYSYYLEGLDPASVNWSSDTKKEYNHIPEGRYVFHVKSKNIYGLESEEAIFAFTILPPWYRTWWSYLLYGVIGYIAVVVIVRINLWRLHQIKKRLERTINERTNEVLRQKELIELEKIKVEEQSAVLEKTLNDLKQTQSQLIQSEKMASLGLLTAGIAHELNNPINFVSANIAPLQKDISELLDLIRKYDAIILDKKDNEFFKPLSQLRSRIDLTLLVGEINKLMAGVEEGSKRTAEIVKGLRSFSRTDNSDMKRAQVNDLIDSTLIILHNKIKERIEIVRSYGNLPEINCYPGQLNQVFMNILNNAIQSIVEMGKICITTSVQGRQIVISIRDTGNGMTEKVKTHLFDPFFTTKAIGEGTGLGLSISYGIIEKHGGKIEVKSEVGKGSEFLIILPIEQME